ncbi:hypothetical protein Hmuk_3216 [Halomicrobium mukohataei DSM 12286]|uniref:Uncharacterized protein n=1 Tax=Halomicrobium mukohataei (strain ATCC 700874 / DSM 12286 / JCM 9738 / NCIMB 13541) TaxID=485914 RepID=C7P2K4_HALMD|nr:hypothetical protein Hmuk_3216 [Halomicrobium mukohataei DSM 12286]
MESENSYLAIITVLLSIITLEIVSDSTSGLFQDIGSAIAILVLLILPLYLVGRIVYSMVG